VVLFFVFQAEDGIRDRTVTGVQTCALPISAFENALAEARRAGRAIAPLRVGYVPYLSVEMLTRFLGALRKRLPDVHTSVANLPKIGRASCRERVEITVDAGSRKKQKNSSDV